MYSSNAISQKITLRYLLAVGFIAILSSSAYFSFSYLSNTNEATAAVVNISGKQRMLSQRVALYSHQLIREPSTKRRLLIKAQLQDAMQLMTKGHQALTQGSIELNIPKEHSQVIHNMYFGELNMDERTLKYIKAVQNLLVTEAKNLTFENTDYLYIEQHFNALLTDLNNIVSQYQKEGEQSVQTIKKLELYLWLLTLLILILEIQFIFRPMAKEVTKALIERERYQAKLEQAVKEKTEELVKANINLNKISNTDPLTGLKNRRSLETKLQEFHNRFIQKKAHYSVVIIDLDCFKKLNDNYGHACGDMVLIKLAEVLTHFLDEKCVISRYGGEEFLILIPDYDSKKAFETINKIREIMAETFFECNEQKINISFSAGLSNSEHYHDIENSELIRFADIALYNAKKSGRNQVKDYKSLDTTTLDQLT